MFIIIRILELLLFYLRHKLIQKSLIPLFPVMFFSNSCKIFTTAESPPFLLAITQLCKAVSPSLSCMFTLAA